MMRVLVQLFISAAVALIGLAIFTRFGVARMHRAFPPRGDFAEVDGLRMHYHESGSGPPLVLLHGASSNLCDFEAGLVTQLRHRYRVVAIDRPGHGYSERGGAGWPDPAEQARRVHRLLGRLGVEHPVVVGHSWSGSVVLAYLLAYPESTTGAVLLAGVSHPWDGGVSWYYELAGVTGVGPLFASTLAYPFGLLTMDRAIARVFAPQSVPADYRSATAVALTLRPRNFLANAQDIRRLSDFLNRQSRRYHEIELPLLLITGTADDIVPAWNHAERLVQQVRRARIVRVPEAGHALHHSHTQDVAVQIATFVNSI